MEGGKGARKSNDITATPMRMTVTPNKKQQREREQDAPKKSRMVMKKGLKDYFGKGKRTPLPSTKGNPISTVVQRRKEQGDTPTGTGGDRAGAFNAETDGHGVRDNTKWSTPITKKGNKSLWASNKDGQNKKPRSDDKDSGGEESKQRRKGSKEEVGQGDFAVDLESMSALLKKKSLNTKAAKKKADKKKQEDSAGKTTRRKKKADKAGEE